MRGDSFVWTDLEEGILIDAVREADNVKRGLQNAAEVLGTTFYICRNRWYKHTQYRLKEQDDSIPALPAAEEDIHKHNEKVEDVKSSLEGFLSDLTKLVDENRKLIEENARLKKELRILEQEKKEINEAYEYILKVINRARELCLQDEDRPARLKYRVSADGTVEIVSA